MPSMVLADIVTLLIPVWILLGLLVLLGIFSVWALVAGPPIAAGAVLLVVWLIASAGALAARRTARKLTLPYVREVGHRR